LTTATNQLGKTSQYQAKKIFRNDEDWMEFAFLNIFLVGIK
jgi:hypothetical protein